MFLVGIAGGSGSGKTTFAKKILNRLSEESVGILHQDSYYLPAPPQKLRVHGEPNFDHPDALDWKRLLQDLQALKKGTRVEVPVYDFSVSRRTKETISLGPCRAVILEGIFTLWHEEVRTLLDLRVYLQVETDIRFIRRLHRDVRERGRTLDGIIRQYYDTVRPMHREYLEHTRQHADLIVGEENDIAADTIAARLRLAL